MEFDLQVYKIKSKLTKVGIPYNHVQIQDYNN